MTRRLYNKNLLYLIRDYHDGKAGALLSGSSRSGKTYSSIHFMIYLATMIEQPFIITIIKESYAVMKSTIFADFRKILSSFGLDNPFDRAKEVRQFRLLSATVQFLGADESSKMHGLQSDFTFFNEILAIPKKVYHQATMRTKQFFWGDYNPYSATHYIFRLTDNDDTIAKHHTTFRDNPYISEVERQRILSFEPTPANIARGTADEYMWKVYGLGERAAPEGQIFRYTDYIDAWPSHIEPIYGLDFGFTTDPTALVRVGMDDERIYTEALLYKPTDNPATLNEHLAKLIPDPGAVIIADSADKYTGENKGTVEMVRDLRTYGWNITKVHKTRSVMYWLTKMKERKLTVINNPLATHFKKELSNYVYKTVNGITINQPVEHGAHLIDATRYGFMASAMPVMGFV